MIIAAFLIFFVWCGASGAVIGRQMKGSFDWLATIAVVSFNMLLGLTLFGKVFQ